MPPPKCFERARQFKQALQPVQMRFVQNIDWLSRHEKSLDKVKKIQQLRIGNQFKDWKLKETSASSSMRRFNLTRFKNGFLRKAVREDFLFEGSFQEAIKPALVLAQIFGLMPVEKVTSKSARDLRFKWTNYRTVFCFTMLIFTGLFTLQTWVWSMKYRLDFTGIEVIMFYTSVFIGSALLFNLARKWPELMVKFEETEKKLPQYQSHKEKAQLAHRIKILTFVISALSLIEHILSMLTGIYYANKCPAIEDSPIDSFLLSNFIQFFAFFDYNVWVALLAKYMNVLAAFTWNFIDLFLMIVSIGISTRFRQLNDDLFSVKYKPTSREYWITSRTNYRNLCKLCEEIDNRISPITLLSFANNLYFLCVKILKSLYKKPTATHTVYFWFSLGYLLARTFMLSMYSAAINDESKRPLQVFRTVPRESWSAELKRFTEEVTTDQIALTGMKFFNITRGLVITVGGTIVTYELVLLQFSEDAEEHDC